MLMSGESHDYQYKTEKTISLSQYEVDNLTKLLTFMNAFGPNMFNFSTGDWTDQILHRLHPDDHDKTYKVPVPGDAYLHDMSEVFRIGDPIESVELTVSMPYISSDLDIKRFQMITFMYKFSKDHVNNLHPSTNLLQRKFFKYEIYVIEDRNHEYPVLTEGYYNLSDYVVMRAIVDEKFKK